MNLSMRWLSDYLDISDISVRQFAADMTMSGSKVEGYETEGEKLKNIVVGRVLSVEKHPNADTLFICKIDMGGETCQIITAATNVVPGALVPAALDRSVLHGGKEIRKGKLRGEVSEGMLCSLEELGLTKGDFPYAEADGIFLMQEECALGQDIQTALGLDDTVVEFEITSNRPDCLSVIGLARETAATYGRTATIPPPVYKGGGGAAGQHVKVTVENSALCQRYAAAVVTDVKIGPSPRWLRERLRASGVRPINNIVDITNYVMLEYGHPMHAFDLRHVKGAQIIVRNAAPGESITTLDGVQRALSPEMLVIADAQAPSAIAGVMGGEFSGIYEDTQVVVFESACFNGASVRTTAKKVGLRTESSARFEKGLDPHTCEPALRRACQLVEMLGAGVAADDFVDVWPTRPEATTLPLNPEWINGFLGVDIPAARMEEILESLSFTVKNGMVTAPTWRADIKEKEDLAEEIARIYGYNNLPTTRLRGESNAQVTREQHFERLLANELLAQGFYEIMTYSFMSPKHFDKIRLPKNDPKRHCVVISNPLGEDTGVMRTTAMPAMLEVLARNFNSRNPAASLYEVASEYLPQGEGELPLEPKRLLLGQYGAGADFFALKGALEALLERAGIIDWSIERCEQHPTFHPGRCANLLVAGRHCGVFGELHPEVCSNYEIGTRAYLADFDFALLLEHCNLDRQYCQLPRYPASTRDLALLCDEQVPVGDIQQMIAGAMSHILEKIKLFDIYRGAQVGEGKKSVAFALTLRAADRTLTDQECDRAVEKALRVLEKSGVTLR
jgi:phenylalanyl-tRNA synthetase, beta subunit, non-spirochete bacterial